jgi:hypothetical protein
MFYLTEYRDEHRLWDARASMFERQRKRAAEARARHRLVALHRSEFRSLVNEEMLYAYKEKR